MENPLELSIVIPCLNEAETITICIEKSKKYLESNRIRGEIIIADNGSVDGSAEIAIHAGARVVHVSERGYGSALLGGFEAALGNYIIMGDADDSYDFSNLNPFMSALRSGSDMVIGNRFKGGIMPSAMPFLHQYIGNPVLSWLGRLFFKNQVSDFHCGLRGFRREAILALGLQMTGMEFASEMIVKASIRGLKITEVPTILYPDGRSRPSHLRTWADGWRHLRFLLMNSPRWLFFYPGLFLMGAGFLVSAWLLPGPQKIGAVTLDINTLMYSAFFIILGLQAVLFSFYTRVFSMSLGLLPRDRGTEKLRDLLSLEKGVAISILLILLGICSSIGAIVYWGRNLFGPIDPSISMRLVIPGTVMFSAGIQILFSSFFLSILMTKRK